MSFTDAEARQRVGRLEELLAGLEELPEPSRAAALDAVAGLVELYGEALARVLALVPGEAAGALAGDELVSHLLMVHGLHPASVEERVLGALDEVRPYLASHGGGVELVAVEGADVRLRLEGSCSGCPSSTATLKLAVEDAIRAAVPEVERIEADGALEEEPLPGLALPLVRSGPAGAGWTVVGKLPELVVGATLLREASGEDVLFARVDSGNGVYAYRPPCPGCGESLAGALLERVTLVCAGCGRRYDVAAAGRCLDEPALHLEPLPLLVGEGGNIRIAKREAVAS